MMMMEQNFGGCQEEPKRKRNGVDTTIDSASQFWYKNKKKKNNKGSRMTRIGFVFVIAASLATAVVETKNINKKIHRGMCKYSYM